MINNKIRKGFLKQNNSSLRKLSILGIVSLFIWYFYFFEKIFISIETIFLILLLPTLIIYIIIRKRIVNLIGYKQHIKNDFEYNFIINAFGYLYSCFSIGNVIVMSIMMLNFIPNNEDVLVENLSIDSYGRMGSRNSSYLYVEYDDIEKKFIMNKLPSYFKGKDIEFKVRKGFLNYYIINDWEVK